MDNIHVGVGLVWLGFVGYFNAMFDEFFSIICQILNGLFKRKNVDSDQCLLETINEAKPFILQGI